ncbi:MAG: phage baseplate assembly protein V [Undibacterium umbellatum]|uniref:phage baseplate assembly protein V n=1 Tax=Undibacterium umbellatum TaxID=2762300 RepID=UPI003BB7A8FF
MMNDDMGEFSPGVSLATVSNTRDEQNLGRIKVKFLLKGAQIESDWVQIVSFFAGTSSGAFFLPRVGDSALVAFADGDPSKPYVLGFLWNGQQKPPVANVEQQQTTRVIKTKGGKTITFDDSDQGKISIVDNKNNQILIDTSANKISLISQGDISISAVGSINIKGSQVVVQNTGGSVKADLTAASMQLTGGTNLKLSATMIDIN